jgi:hypothetical protein
MTYNLPDDRLPRPALPTAQEARAAVDRLVTDIGAEYQPIELVDLARGCVVISEENPHP